MLNRRKFLTTTATAAAGTIGVIPMVSFAGGHADSIETDAGPLIVHPVNHASVVLDGPAGVIYVDPVGDPGQYAELPAPDLILVTHEHGDHYNEATLTALRQDGTHLIANPAVSGMLAEELADGAETLGNGDSTTWSGLGIEAIAAYNTTEGRLNFHPRGRDNGYVLTTEDGFRIYLSGDTEDIPEMRALRDIDLAFVSMNLPFTMDAAQAASAVAEFRPRLVYPYHYRGRDGGTQDPEEFAALVGDAAEVRFGDWY